MREYQWVTNFRRLQKRMAVLGRIARRHGGRTNEPLAQITWDARHYRRRPTGEFVLAGDMVEGCNRGTS